MRLSNKAGGGRRIRHRSGLRAFSLTELLAALVVVAVLVALTYPAVSKLSNLGKNTKCVNNLRQIATASMAYAGDHQGLFPNFYYDDVTGAEEQAPNAVVGQWYWHLAPYLKIKRWEDGGMNLGEKGTAGLGGPCVFLCPATDPEREDVEKHLVTYPSHRPVTYAPSTKARGPLGPPPAGLPSGTAARVIGVRAPRLNQIVHASRKIWISDSVGAGLLNISVARWSPDYGAGAWPYQAFTRHDGGGNALFYDGHIERIPITTFSQPENGHLPKTLDLYFNPGYATNL